MNKYVVVLMLFAISAMAACGGGGGGGGFFLPPPAQPTVAVLTFSTTQVNPGETVTIGGIGVSVDLPAGVTARTIDSAGNVDASVVAPSGAAANATTKTGIFADGRLSVLVADAANGFSAGQYVTLTLDIASGYSPTTADFVISAFQPSDLGGNDISAKLTNGFTADIH